MNRAMVGQFFKEPSGHFRLFSLTVVEEGEDRGRAYRMRKSYDVDYSRRYGYLFHMSGAGGSHAEPVDGPYFACGDLEVEERSSTLVNKKARDRNRTRRLRAIPKAFDLEPGQDLLGWLQHNAIQQDAVWCSECKDNVPGDELCEHCWWCGEIGWYSTPSDRCGCKGGRAACEA